MEVWRLTNACVYIHKANPIWHLLLAFCWLEIIIGGENALNINYVPDRGILFPVAPAIAVANGRAEMVTRMPRTRIDFATATERRW